MSLESFSTDGKITFGSLFDAYEQREYAQYMLVMDAVADGASVKKC